MMQDSSEGAWIRVETLRMIADDHALSANHRTSGGKRLAEDLAAPERLGRWCVVSFSVAERNACLDPHHQNSAGARTSAEWLLGDPTSGELPMEVVDLDTGARQIAQLGVVSWGLPGGPDLPTGSHRSRARRPHCGGRAFGP